MYPVMASLTLFYSLHHVCGKIGQIWDIDDRLEDRVFDNPLMQVVSRSESSCVMTCMMAADCVMLTFSKDTGVCRGHSAYFTPSDPSTYSPSTTVWKLNPCYPYIYDTAVNMCYELKNSALMTYKQLKETCAADGATLPILNTKEKQEAIASVLTTPLPAVTMYYWVGGSDTQVEGVWRWWNGEAMNMSNTFWNPSEPNDYSSGEDCGALEVGAKLNDVHCDSRIFGICQKDIT